MQKIMNLDDDNITGLFGEIGGGGAADFTNQTNNLLGIIIPQESPVAFGEPFIDVVFILIFGLIINWQLCKLE